mmetsp:Transcript_13368/g.23989  ORF Transcript_13368/g.23989 Transcript_13368/m.23989 type:complete len:228 (+) Transcript_13368:74-757(+)
MGDDLCLQWKQYSNVMNPREELVQCWKKLWGRDGFGELPLEIVQYIGMEFEVPLVFVTQMCWNRGSTGTYGAVVVIGNGEVLINGTRVNKARLGNAADAAISQSLIKRGTKELDMNTKLKADVPQSVSWTQENNLSLLADYTRPVAAQIYISQDTKTFSGVCWVRERGDDCCSIRLWYGRRVENPNVNPLGQDKMWNMSRMEPLEAIETPPVDQLRGTSLRSRLFVQ